MFAKPFKKSNIHRILFISLSNIGDVILTFPVLDILKKDFPEAKLDVIVGPKAQSLFQNNSQINKLIIFHKKSSSLVMIRWIWNLRREKYDMIVDLRNTVIPALIPSTYRTSLRVKKNYDIHMREKHLKRLTSVYQYKNESQEKTSLAFSDEDQKIVREMISMSLNPNQNYFVIAPGAADQAKRWSEAGFARLSDTITKQHGWQVVIVGDESDNDVALRIGDNMSSKSLNLCGKVSLTQLALVLQSAQMAIVNDSASMHLASYVNIPILAIFKCTDPTKYGPWSKNCHFVKIRNQSTNIEAQVSTLLNSIQMQGEHITFRK